MQHGSLPAYQQSLGAIGRYMDQHRYADLLLCELGDGFVGRVTLDNKLMEAIPFQAGDLASMIRVASEESARASSIPAPSPRGSFVGRVLGGYRAFLTAVGRQLDVLDAGSVVILELPSSLLIAYERAANSQNANPVRANEFLYDEAGLRKLVLASAAGSRA